MTPTAISEARWREAQQYEAAYWAKEMKDPEKLWHDIEDGHAFTKALLDIRHSTINRATVIDIAGGPYPIGFGLVLERYTVIDPATYPEVPGIERVLQCAEDFVGIGATEVWGYNALQHVRDPERVMKIARAHAHERVRWFDVVDTPVYPVHPHSISAAWLRAELSRDGWRIVRDIDGSRLIDQHTRQKWVALVAERG